MNNSMDISSMILLILGLVIFIGIHFVPAIPSLKHSLVSRLSAKGYKGIFSIVALVGFVLIVIGKMNADFVHVYAPLNGAKHIAMTLMLIAFILLPAAHMKGNIKRFTRHPMLWGVVCWSAAHLLANGDLASIIMFGSLGLYSLLGMITANARGAQKQTEKLPIKKDLIVFAAGFTTYVAIMFLHPFLFGYAIIGS
ncbi:MAG: NnrU family protein [Cellvibrionaceae bacterium]